ncbi:hypothetical protein BGZ49_002047, partial [Haplosporangium sp. Z 27]
MYPNPYPNNNNEGYPGSPPPHQQGYPAPPPGSGPYPPPGSNSYPPQGGNPYPPPGNGPYPPSGGAYPPPGGAYVPQTSYQPHTTYQPQGTYPPPLSGSQSPYPPVVPIPSGGMYPPPITSPTSGAYPAPPPGPPGNPFGATVTTPYGLPTSIPTPQPSGAALPHDMPVPHGYGQQHQQPPFSPPTSHQQPSFSPPTSQRQQYPQQQYEQFPYQQQQQQEQQGPGPNAAFKCGPLLRYQNMDIHRGIWHGSALVVSKPEAYNQPPPVLTWSDGRSAPQHVTGHKIETYNSSNFWKFPLEIPQDTHASKKITYSINHGPNNSFHVASRADSFRWMFYSCNGFSLSVDSIALGGANPLWNDVLAKHAEHPYNVMIGGGDQLYCDGLLDEKEMLEWLKISTVSEREKIAVKQHWLEAIERYYFNRYCSWFSQGSYGIALATIPSVNMWDDHDTVDGYGSYPESTQKSPTMLAIGAASRRFYLLFQQHTNTNPAMLSRNGFFSAGVGESILTSLGPSASLLVLDARSERTKNVICSDSTYDLAFTKIYEEIPQGTRHLLVQLGVPIAYPRLVFAENLMGSVGTVLGSISGAKNVVNKLNGEPELLDDLNDHWTAKSHKVERNKFITRLQNFANDRKIRVTFLSGDVHCAGVGRFYAKISPPENDPQLMYQIISSAIVNEPPPEGVIKLLHFQDKVHTLKGGRVTTYEDMYPMFTTDVDDKPLTMDKLMPRRNFSHGHFNHHTKGMEITIFAEKIRGGPEHTPGADK